MWNFGTMHPQGPKNPDTQPKPGAPFLASFARSGAFSPKAEGTPCTPWIPNSALRPLHPDSINSIVRKTLLATPEFPRLYADMVLATRPNSHEAKILRPQYQKVLSCPKCANRATSQNPRSPRQLRTRRAPEPSAHSASRPRL